MSFDPIRLNLEMPDTGAAFAALTGTVLAPVLRTVPVGAGEVAESGLAVLPEPPPPFELSAADLPATRPVAVLATPFTGADRRWVTAFLFPHPRFGHVRVGAAELSLYVDRGIATVSLTFPLAGWPLADVTLGRADGEAVIAAAPGRAAATGDFALVAGALADLDAAFSDRVGRRWVFDYTARVDPDDHARLEALRHRLASRA